MMKIRGNFNVPMLILIPTITSNLGQVKKTYPNPNDVQGDMQVMCGFKTYGGTETTINGILAIENTAMIQTYYRPDITSQIALYDMLSGITYEVIGEVENIERRNQFVQFKVKAIKGGI